MGVLRQEVHKSRKVTPEPKGVKDLNTIRNQLMNLNIDACAEEETKSTSYKASENEDGTKATSEPAPNDNKNMYYISIW